MPGDRLYILANREHPFWWEGEHFSSVSRITVLDELEFFDALIIHC